MLEKILPHELGILYWINSHHSAYLDRIMWRFSSTFFWLPIGLLILLLIIYKQNWKVYLPFLVVIGATIFLGDNINAQYIRPYVHRWRPTHFPGVMEHIRYLHNHPGGNYGFMSSHATNFWGLFILLALYFKNRSITLLMAFFATLVCYSRLYCGVHFLSDVIGGGILGIIVGGFCYLGYQLINKRFRIKRQIVPNKFYNKVLGTIGIYCIAVITISIFV